MNSSPLTETMLSLRNAGVYYKRWRGVLGEPFWALKDVSFDLRRGETLGVIGRNGAGKSTLLRMMSGIIKPNTGQFTNYGCMVSLLSLQLGFIAHLTGRENAVLSGLLMGLKRKEIEDKMAQIIEFSELGEFIDHPVGTYSSGMNARLGFSVAFQIDPDVLLIDEVMGVGDAEFAQKSTALMQERIREENKTVVFVSHNALTVRQLCSRVVWIEDGVSRMEGAPAEVIAAYHQHLQVKAG